MSTNFQTKRSTLNSWVQICPKVDFGQITMCNIQCVSSFSQNEQLLIFWPKFWEIAQLRAIFWFKNCWGWCRELGGGWNKLGGGGWSWVEVNGAGWMWVHGLVIPIYFYLNNVSVDLSRLIACRLCCTRWICDHQKLIYCLYVFLINQQNFLLLFHCH